MHHAFEPLHFALSARKGLALVLRVDWRPALLVLGRGRVRGWWRRTASAVSIQERLERSHFAGSGLGLVVVVVGRSSASD